MSRVESRMYFVDLRMPSGEEIQVPMEARSEGLAIQAAIISQASPQDPPDKIRPLLVSCPARVLGRCAKCQKWLVEFRGYRHRSGELLCPDC